MYLANMVYYGNTCCWTFISWCKMQTRIQHIKANMMQQSSYDWSTIQHNNLSLSTHGISYNSDRNIKHRCETYRRFESLMLMQPLKCFRICTHLLVMYPHRPQLRMCKSIALICQLIGWLPAKKARWLQHKANSSSLVCWCPYHHHKVVPNNRVPERD